MLISEIPETQQTPADNSNSDNYYQHLLIQNF